MVLLGLALVATACGGGGGDDELVAAIAASAERDAELPEDFDTQCMAEAMVKNLGGASAIEENYGITAENFDDEDSEFDDIELSKDDAYSMADGMMDCGITDLLVTELESSVGMSADEATCVLEGMDQDLLRDTFAVEFMSPAEGDPIRDANDAAAFSAMLDSFGSCGLDPSSLGN